MISLQDVSLAARGRVRLHPTTFSIGPGTLTVIVGRNGSGKSTLLSLLAAELRPTTGVVRIDGDAVGTLTARELARRRALLGQDQQVSFPFRVREVVAWGRHCWAGTVQSQDDDTVIDQMLVEQGIADLESRLVNELSGGERQRVHLARVRAQRAPVLLLDEADASLDLEGRHHLAQIARAEAERGTAVVMVSHDVRRHLDGADRVIVIDGGRVALDEPTRAVDPSVVASLLGVPQI